MEVIDEQEQKRFAEADENGATEGQEGEEPGYRWSGVSNPPEEKPHVEEYMLALLEKEMKGVPIVFHAAAKDKKAARRAKDKLRKR